MKSSSAAPRLRLKPEQARDGSKKQGGGLSSGLELRLGISSDNGGDGPWLGVGTHPWSLASRQEKAALEQAHQRQPVGWPPVGRVRDPDSAVALNSTQFLGRVWFVLKSFQPLTTNYGY